MQIQRVFTGGVHPKTPDVGSCSVLASRHVHVSTPPTPTFFDLVILLRNVFVY